MKKKVGKLYLLNDEIVDELIEYVGEDIFPDVASQFQKFRNQIEHENIAKEREILIGETLNSLRDGFKPFFSSFPEAEIDFSGKRVNIRSIDIDDYFKTIFEISAETDKALITKLSYGSFKYEVKKIVEIGSWNKMMVVLLQYWEGTDPLLKFDHLKIVFSDVAVYTELRKLFSFNNLLSEKIENVPNSLRLKAELAKYGFFNLPMVASLSEQSKQMLVEWISSKKLPYAIAMFDFLGFLNYLEREYFKIKRELQKEVAKWFNKNNGDRGVRGNINILFKNSKENKTRYTAYQLREIVQEDYQKLKIGRTPLLLPLNAPDNIALSTIK